MKLEKKSNSLSSFFSLVVLCAWIFLAFFGYRMVLRCNQEMERYSRLVNIELERDGPDGVAVQRMQEVEAEQEEPLSFTFWTSLGERKLEARTTGVIQQSQVYMLWGPSEVFF